MARRQLVVAIILRDLTNQANTVVQTRRLTFSGPNDRATIQAGVVLTARAAMKNAECVIGATVPEKAAGGGFEMKTRIMWRKVFGAMQAGEYVLIERGVPVSLKGI